MEERLITEEDYRETLKRFLDIITDEDVSENEEGLNILISLMECYEYENC